MSEQRITRRLAVILCADIVGYTRLVAADEAGTLSAFKRLKKTVVNPALIENGGRLFKTMGDGLLAEFNSAVAAVEAAHAIQSAVAKKATGIILRIGITLGDIVVDGDDLLGDGVNMAARLQAVSWPGGFCITSGVYDQVRRRLDLDFSDGGAVDLKGVPEPVRVWHWQSETADRPPAGPARPETFHSGRPSIAVLPFTNRSGKGEHEHFADAITEDLITALARIPGFAVIGRGTSFSYKGRQPGLRDIARELGVDYALEGSVRWAGDAVRISAQLSEATKARQIWAQNFDGRLTDVFAFQDEITRKIAASIQPELIRSLAEAQTAATPGNMRAWIAFARGRKSFWRWEKDNLEQAERHFRHAIDLEPGYADAHALLSIVLWGLAISGFAASSAEALGEAAALARKALNLDEHSATGHLAMAVSALSAGNHNDAMAEAERAVELLPGQSDVLNLASIPLVYGGSEEQALSWAEESLRLNPREPAAYGRYQMIATANFALERYADALAAAERVASLQPDWLEARTIAIASLVQLGRVDEAKRQFRSAQAKNRNYSAAYAVRRHPFRRADVADRLREALTVAAD